MRAAINTGRTILQQGLGFFAPGSFAGDENMRQKQEQVAAAAGIPLEAEGIPWMKNAQTASGHKLAGQQAGFAAGNAARDARDQAAASAKLAARVALREANQEAASGLLRAAGLGGSALAGIATGGVPGALNQVAADVARDRNAAANRHNRKVDEEEIRKAHPFQSQSFASGGDFARFAIEKALSSPDDDQKKQLAELQKVGTSIDELRKLGDTFLAKVDSAPARARSCGGPHEHFATVPVLSHDAVLREGHGCAGALLQGRIPDRFVRKYRCDGQRELLGQRTASGLVISSYSPHQHPLSTNLFCKSADVLEGLDGPALNSYGYPGYNGGALIRCEYRPLLFDVVSQPQNSFDTTGSEPIVWATQELDFGSETYTVNRATYTYQAGGAGINGQPSQVPVKITIPITTLILTFERTPYLAMTVVRSLRFRVNTSTFLGASAGLVRFDGARTTRQHNSDGSICQKTQFVFQERDSAYPWNALPNTVDMTWNLVKDGSGNTIHPTADLTPLASL